MNKSGIQLSINFVIMFILAMSIFGVGIKITRDIFNQADDLKTDLDVRTKQEIEKVFYDSPAKIVIPFPKQEVKHGGYGMFGIGIRNDLDAEKTFVVEIECDAAFNTTSGVLCDADSGFPDFCTIYDSWFASVAPITIKRHDKEAIPILFLLPKSDPIKEGLYIFNQKVCTINPDPLIPPNDCDGTNSYGTVKKLKIQVSQ